MDDKWIDNIRDKMADYDVVPPDGLLDAVRNDVRSRMRRKRFIWWSVAASIALLVGLFVPILFDNVDDSIPLLVDVSDLDKHRKKEAFRRPAEKALFSATTISKHIGSPGVSVSAMNDPNSSSQLVIEDSQGKFEKSPEVEDNLDAKPNRGSSSSSDANDVDTFSDVNTFSKEKSVSKSSLSVGVSASANGLGGLLNSEDIGGNAIKSSTQMPFTRMGGGVLTDAPLDDKPIPSFVEIFDHKIPVRFSIDFSWHVGHHLNIGTGLCYSYLRSDIMYGYSDFPLLKASQNLHFIGVPVNVRYTPWRYRKFAFYTSVGFMAEKCIWGEIKEEYQSNSGYTYEGSDERPFQFSFNAAAGIQCNLTHKCAVFIEPGVGMYIKNGSRLRSIYSERPLTFNINVGFRFGY
ncbi:MAG: hypothetical protein K2K32_01315 [Muribaculaceae bacterium]|nr:hypothetical protein [Muribaculaceae bacterium]